MSRKLIDDLVEYYTDMFHLDKHTLPPEGVVNKLNMLDRVERGALKSRLFTEAKRLGVGGDGVRAIRWLESTFEQVEKYSFRLHDVVFSPGQDIPENIGFFMAQAKKSIDLCVFTISDEKLCECLKTLHARGIKIRLITDNNKMRDAGSQVKELARAGIEVKTDNSRYHMHNKFGIVDGRIAFTGSYNWTYTAQNFNQENLVITTNFTIVHRFMDEFENLWGTMYWLRVKQSKDGSLKARVKVADKYQELEFAPDNANHPTHHSAHEDGEGDEMSAEPQKPRKHSRQSIKQQRNERAKEGGFKKRKRDHEEDNSSHHFKQRKEKKFNKTKRNR